MWKDIVQPFSLLVYCQIFWGEGMRLWTCDNLRSKKKLIGGIKKNSTKKDFWKFTDKTRHPLSPEVSWDFNVRYDSKDRVQKIKRGGGPEVWTYQSRKEIRMSYLKTFKKFNDNVIRVPEQEHVPEVLFPIQFHYL